MLPNQQLFINATEPDSNARLFIFVFMMELKEKSLRNAML